MVGLIRARSWESQIALGDIVMIVDHRSLEFLGVNIKLVRCSLSKWPVLLEQVV
jgi:hypothetical protein